MSSLTAKRKCPLRDGSKVVSDLGIEPDRLALEWVSAGEGHRFREVINGFLDRIIELGPNPLGKKGAPTGRPEAAPASP